MNLHEVETAQPDDEVVITGRDLKTLLRYATMLGAGYSLKGDDTFRAAKELLAVIESAIPLKG